MCEDHTQGVWALVHLCVILAIPGDPPDPRPWNPQGVSEVLVSVRPFVL